MLIITLNISAHPVDCLSEYIQESKSVSLRANENGDFITL